MAEKTKDIPKWAQDEIRTAKFGKPQSVTGAGYVLEVYEKDAKADVQLYEPVGDGRHIVTMDIGPGVKASDMERGVTCEFAFESCKAPLSAKVVKLLREEQGIEMDAIYQFTLKKMTPIEAESGA